MAKPKTAPSMTMATWLERAAAPEVREAIAGDVYAGVYPHLIAAFRAMPDPLSVTDAIAGVHIAYGWMPTIARPATMLSVLRGDAARLLGILNAVRRASAPRLGRDDALLLQAFANNSAVGASKLLHFLNPGVYPIWDSRVAERFMWQGVSRETYEQVPRLLEYVNAVWQWSSDGQVRAVCAELRTLNPLLHDATDIRLIELVLFYPAPTPAGAQREQ